MMSEDKVVIFLSYVQQQVREKKASVEDRDQKRVWIIKILKKDFETQVTNIFGRPYQRS